MHKFLLVLFFFLGSSIEVNCQTVYNPIQFGLFDANSSIERYEILYRTHYEAKKNDAKVSYKGIKTIEIEIPLDAKSIPLTYETEFAGVNIYVTNNSKDIFLFELIDETLPVKVSKEQVDRGVFIDVGALSKGRYILVLEDCTPWIKERIGYGYPIIRKDILLIINGKSVNQVVSPYNNDWTEVKASYRAVPNKQITIRNLNFYRQPENKKKVFLMYIYNQNNVLLSNIVLHTPPKDTLKNDDAIKIRNCTNIRFKQVTIDGSYSQKNKYGYGISMDNVWNCSFYKFYGFGNWGIFGNNNISFATFNHCEMNRFDIHCYGKDVYFKNCVFRDMYNQFSSIFGTISFVNCKFINFIPVSIEDSFNAYTSFKLKITNCSVSDAYDNNYLIRINGIRSSTINSRPELIEKFWPEVSIDGLTVFSDDSLIYRLSDLSNKNIHILDDKNPSIIKLKRVVYKNSIF